MGILNINGDSFYAGSRAAGVEEALLRAEQMLQEGALMLDVGGQSTRPGSLRIDAAEEAGRVIPVVEALSKAFPQAFISVDTYHAAVARQAVAAGAGLVNDISAGLMDEGMLAAVAGLGVPFIAMHMQGRPETMQEQPVYADVLTEVFDFLAARAEACRLAGINDVVIDPGFGFGKTAAHNFRLLRHISAFGALGRPVLLGVSRKSMIWKTLGCTAEEALNGSTVLHTAGLLGGISILRVHDVKAAVEAVKLVRALGGND